MRTVVVALVLAVVAVAGAKGSDRAACERASGDEAARCLAAFVDVDSTMPAFADAAVHDACSDDVAYAIGALGADDLALVLRDACADFGTSLLRLGAPPAGAGAACRAALATTLVDVRERTIALLGPQCAVRTAQGRRCRRLAQEARARRYGRVLAKRTDRRCPELPDGVGALVDAYVERVRHFAILAYPPNDLGPSGDLGRYPVGVRSLALVDASRPDVDGEGPRPVDVEIWYPSTPEAVAGHDRYVVNLFGFDVARTPNYRDVDRAAGPFPLVLFSHGNAGINFQSIFLATHLASHGYVVASPNHRGNTFVDIAAGDVDPAVATNRPLDVKFVLDDLLARNAAAGDFFSGAIDAERIGMSGHSFGGYTTFALAAGPAADPRMKAFMPLAPASPFDAAFFASITAPILVQGGSLDRTTPFASQQLAPYQALQSGAAVVALAEIAGAGHFTFSDICEVPRNLVGAIGGFDEACTPEHLPWRHAHDLIDYLALNFFDATLRGDKAALRRLRPRAVASLGDVDYQRK